MDLDFNPQEQAFRQEVRQFLADSLPADIRERMHRGDDSHIRHDIQQWQKILHAKGWGAPAWPEEFGGTGWSKTQQFIGAGAAAEAGRCRAAASSCGLDSGPSIPLYIKLLNRLAFWRRKCTGIRTVAAI